MCWQFQQAPCSNPKPMLPFEISPEEILGRLACFEQALQCVQTSDPEALGFRVYGL